MRENIPRVQCAAYNNLKQDVGLAQAREVAQSLGNVDPEQANCFSTELGLNTHRASPEDNIGSDGLPSRDSGLVAPRGPQNVKQHLQDYICYTARLIDPSLSASLVQKVFQVNRIP